MYPDSEDKYGDWRPTVPVPPSTHTLMLMIDQNRMLQRLLADGHQIACGFLMRDTIADRDATAKAPTLSQCMNAIRLWKQATNFDPLIWAA